MHARSALFDVYGDHLRRRGGLAPVAALVRLLASLDISVPAVRTAVSRMVRQGWLEPVRLGGGAGYQLTERAERRLDAAHARIYRTSPAAGWASGWDGTWHLVSLERAPGRAARERLEGALRLLGYAPLGASLWVAPRRSDDVAATLAAEGVQGHAFTARPDGDPAALVARAWHLQPVAHAYTAWTAMATDLLAQAGEHPDDRTSFALRSRLVHEWRKFLFTDPALPPDLLPPGWPGQEAARLFDTAAARLRPGAEAFVDACLEADPGLLGEGPPGPPTPPTLDIREPPP